LEVGKVTLQGINISPKNGILKMIFPTSQGGICIHSLEGNVSSSFAVNHVTAEVFGTRFGIGKHERTP